MKYLWQRVQPRVFLGMTLQTWHTCIWGDSLILLYRSSQALSGWMGSIVTQLISGLSRDVRSGSSPGSGWATQGHSETCPEYNTLLCCIGCVLRVVVLLEGEPSPQSEDLSALQKVFIKDLSVLCFVHLASILTSLQFPAAEKLPKKILFIIKK